MLHTLIESRAARQRRTGGTLISVAAHTGLIAAAVALTARAAPAPRAPIVPEPVVFVRTAPPPPPAAAPARADPPSGPVPAAPSIAIPVIAPVALPTHLPAVDPHALAIPHDWYDLKPGPSTSASVPGPASAPANGIYDLRSVDVAVEGDPGNPAPVYPEPLRAAHVEGWVDVQFVVDTTGKAEPASIRVLASTHPLFADAVRAAIGRSRYRPAEAGGRRVRQLVQQRFEFALR